ncbi:hypothetical protein BGX27_000872, partial [Mortierella sp. AM989]
WLVSPDIRPRVDTYTNTPIDSHPQTVHLRPTHGDSTTDINTDITPIQNGKNTTRKELGNDVASRADVLVGVIIFSVGMLVLIGAMIFYFVNGRSWRAIKAQPDTLEAGVGDDDAEEKQPFSGNITPTTTTKDVQLSHDGETTEPELSPSTARLEDPPTKSSVFAFLKGSHRQSVSSDSNTDPLTGVTNMPVLTRTKARRSSVKRELGSIMQPRNRIAEASQHHHISMNIQEPNLAFYPASTTGTPARKQQRSDITVFSKPHDRSTTPVVLRLDMPRQPNPSIIGLYGSAKSSPNGSLADAASVQAIYCHSLRSAMSYTTHAESAMGLDCPDTESKEVVLATADMGHQHN